MYQAAAPAGRHSEPPTGVYGSYGSSSSSRAFSDEEGAPTEAGGEDDLLQEDKAVVEGLTVGGYSVRKLAKVALMLGLALVLSVFAFTNVQDQFVQTTSGQGGTFDIFKVTSLDDIPRDSIFGNFSSPAQQKLFAMFLEKYSKDISPEDYGEMFRTFKYNLDKIDNRNADEQKRGGTARHGINKFTGWTDEQLAKLRGAKRDKSSSSSKDKSDSDSDSSSSSSSDSISTKLNRRGVATPVSTTNKYSGTATSVDWSDVYTTAIRDQGYCGGCWAFSAVAQMESDGIRQGLLTTNVVLSPQQLISCSSDNDACDGGWTEFAFSYAMTEGIELDSDYPYTSYDEDVATCAAVTSKEAVKVDAFYVLTSETAMIDYVMETGPLSVCVDSANWDSYVDGIVSSCGTNVDHCVQLVGVDLGEGSYKIRNTWGEDWGEGGYIRLKTNENTCGITDDPIYTSVSLIKTVSTTSAPTQKPTYAPTNKAPTNKPSLIPTQAYQPATTVPVTAVPTLAAVTGTVLPTPAVSTATVVGGAPSNHPTLLPTQQPSLPVVTTDATVPTSTTFSAPTVDKATRGSKDKSDKSKSSNKKSSSKKSSSKKSSSSGKKD